MRLLAVAFGVSLAVATFAYSRITNGIDLPVLAYGLWSWIGGVLAAELFRRVRQ